MKDVIKKLNEGLEDPGYRQGWIANIAMAQIDCERWYREENNKVGKYLNYKDRLAIANKGAEYFLGLLTQGKERNNEEINDILVKASINTALHRFESYWGHREDKQIDIVEAVFAELKKKRGQ